MKIVFLDFDGVLNSFFILEEKIKDPNFNFDLLQEDCICCLNSIFHKISDETKIVISSLWRITKTVEELKKVLKDSGFFFFDRVIDKTPVVFNKKLQATIYHRPLEIKTWLEKNKHLDVEDYLIIDDVPLTRYNLHGLNKEKIYQTNSKTGLIYQDIDIIVEMIL